MLFKSKLLTSTTRYLDPGVDMTLFQCSFEVVRLDVGLDTGPSKVIMSPPTVSLALCVSFFWGRMLHTMRQRQRCGICRIFNNVRSACGGAPSRQRGLFLPGFGVCNWGSSGGLKVLRRLGCVGSSSGRYQGACSGPHCGNSRLTPHSR